MKLGLRSKVADADRGPTRVSAVVGSAALAKVAVMGSSGLLAVLTSRLIIAEFGTDAYAQYGLLASFPTLLPFADLGIAAVVINAVAGSKAVRTDEEVRRTLVTAVRILSGSGLIITLLAGLVTLLDGWPTLLGNGLAAEEGSTAAFVCLAIFGAFMPLVVGQRILVGLGRTTSQIAAQAVVAPFMLLSVLAVTALSLPAGNFLAIFSYLGNSLVSVVCLVLAHRHVGPQLGFAFRRVLQFRKYPGVPAFGLAWPMIIQMTALPIAMQTDRLLLSHLTTGGELAQYNLASQLFGLVLQTIAAAGVARGPSSPGPGQRAAWSLQPYLHSGSSSEGWVWPEGSLPPHPCSPTSFLRDRLPWTCGWLPDSSFLSASRPQSIPSACT